MIEICCGSFADALASYHGGAKRIELNSALHMGGLTPTIGSLQLTKQHTDLEVICMVRPRGAGFCYSDVEYQQMMLDAKLLLESGADGLAFGFLLEDGSIDILRTKAMVTLIRQYQAMAVVHRAFDCVKDVDQSIKTLINLKVDRVLTSGLEATALEGTECLTYLQTNYGEDIEILAGSGIRANNAKQIMKTTGITQVHSSCKDWKYDATTSSNRVSYAYGPEDHINDYDIVSQEKVAEIVKALC